MVLGPVFAGGVMLGCKALDEGGELELGHLFAGFKEKLGTLAAVGAIYLVAVDRHRAGGRPGHRRRHVRADERRRSGRRRRPPAR